MAIMEERVETEYRGGKGAPGARRASGDEATTVTHPAESGERSYGDDHRDAINRHKEEMKDMMRRHRDRHRTTVRRHEKEFAAIQRRRLDPGAADGSRADRRRYSRRLGR